MNGPFVKVNCAAIPSDLLESELFGHEKGAFTGAISTRKGKFELADGGTIFLDEVGDLHAASQAKLLRVLQEGEFHRVGGEQPIRVAVRVISATNRNLTDLVTQQKFREDLYYRLCVVPIRVPSLRERPQDIAPLAEYFLDDFCVRNNFHSKQIAEETYPILESYSWPGNARELRNIVERMAILTKGDHLTAESAPVEIRLPQDFAPRSNLKEARESAEREHILRALEESSWNVSGRRAVARHGADQSAQTHSRVGLESGETLAIARHAPTARWVDATDSHALRRGSERSAPNKRRRARGPRKSLIRVADLVQDGLPSGITSCLPTNPRPPMKSRTCCSWILSPTRCSPSTGRLSC